MGIEESMRRAADDVAGRADETPGDDGTLRDAVRDDMGQDRVHVPEGDHSGTPGDDGTLRDSLRDDYLGQEVPADHDPVVDDPRAHPRRDQI